MRCTPGRAGGRRAEGRVEARPEHVFERGWAPKVREAELQLADGAGA